MRQKAGKCTGMRARKREGESLEQQARIHMIPVANYIYQKAQLFPEPLEQYMTAAQKRWKV